MFRQQSLAYLQLSSLKSHQEAILRMYRLQNTVQEVIPEVDFNIIGMSIFQCDIHSLFYFYLNPTLIMSFAKEYRLGSLILKILCSQSHFRSISEYKSLSGTVVV
jgi:hypothetical protein